MYLRGIWHIRNAFIIIYYYLMFDLHARFHQKAVFDPYTLNFLYCFIQDCDCACSAVQLHWVCAACFSAAAGVQWETVPAQRICKLFSVMLLFNFHPKESYSTLGAG